MHVHGVRFATYRRQWDYITGSSNENATEMFNMRNRIAIDKNQSAQDATNTRVYFTKIRKSHNKNRRLLRKYRYENNSLRNGYRHHNGQ